MLPLLIGLGVGYLIYKGGTKLTDKIFGGKRDATQEKTQN
jgi:hypothetical protein